MGSAQSRVPRHPLGRKFGPFGLGTLRVVVRRGPGQDLSQIVAAECGAQRIFEAVFEGVIGVPSRPIFITPSAELLLLVCMGADAAAERSRWMLFVSCTVCLQCLVAATGPGDPLARLGVPDQCGEASSPRPLSLGADHPPG